MWLMNWYKLFKLGSLVLLVLFGFTACSSSPITYADSKSSPEMIKKIEQQYKTWRNTPYRYGGNSLKGIDCSALVMNFYKEKLKMSIPRVTSQQAKLGREVTELKAGDLVFFKTGQGKTGLHVGIYYKKGLFLHVSSSNGVKYSNLNQSYWQSHYWKTKRLIN